MGSARILLSLLLISALASRVASQNCTVSASAKDGYSDLHCSCQLHSESLLKIDTLTLNWTDCSAESDVNLSWKIIEERTHPRIVKLVGMNDTFIIDTSTIWESTLQGIEFQKCSLQTIQENAFFGLSNLIEVRFTNCYIGLIDSDSISNLPKLRYIEFSESNIENISSFAISDLPNLHTLIIARSNITKFENSSIYNIASLTNLQRTQNCTQNLSIDQELGSPMDWEDQIHVPKIGARFVLYENHISYFETSAVNSNMFAFLLLISNYIEDIEPHALTMVLSNTCEISYFLLVDNLFAKTQSNALEFVSGRHEGTYIVMNSNIFEDVARDSFLISPTLGVHSVIGNKFLCKCSLLSWNENINIDSVPERNFELMLLKNSQCYNENLDLSSFIYMCNSGGNDTSYTSPGMDDSNEASTPDSEIKAPSVMQSSSDVANISCSLVFGILMMLIVTIQSYPIV